MENDGTYAKKALDKLPIESVAERKFFTLQELFAHF